MNQATTTEDFTTGNCSLCERRAEALFAKNGTRGVHGWRLESETFNHSTCKADAERASKKIADLTIDDDNVARWVSNARPLFEDLMLDMNLPASVIRATNAARSSEARAFFAAARAEAKRNPRPCSPEVAAEAQLEANLSGEAQTIVDVVTGQRWTFEPKGAAR